MSWEKPSHAPSRPCISLRVPACCTRHRPAGLAGFGVLLYNARIDARALVERDAAAAARSVIVAIERDVAAVKALAQTLATSLSLPDCNIARFLVRTRDAIQHSGIGSNVFLSDASGQQMPNTLQPLGEAH
jgi:hypothetical protein